MDKSVEEADKQVSEMNLSEETAEDEDAYQRFNELIKRGKQLVGEGRIEEALKCNKKALKISYSEKLAKKIKKMEDYLAAHADDSDDDEDNGMMHLGKGFYLYRDLYNSLYAHQQQGVLWLWSLYRRKKGGILGDDMGLGKTIQVIAFLSGMFDMQKIQTVLIVLPVAVMVNWEKEFQKWAPGLKVVAFHGNSKREKERALARVQKRGGICLTTYGLVVTSSEQMGQKDGREFVWDYIILDEGHKIKNPTKTSKGVHAIPARNRIILTGTPVQNNLKELWALFDFVHQGSLLGTQRTFKMEFENPITRAREKDATVGEKKLGLEMAETLKGMIAPYFLRRTKAEVKDQENLEKKETRQEELTHAIMPNMTRKNDLIVWTFLKETQLNIYRDFLSLDSVKELLMTTKSPLVALNVLKKICDHPRLLSTRACAQLGIEGDDGLDDEMLETEAGSLSAVTRIRHIEDNILIKESGKLVFLVELLDRLKVEGHRCLVFSQSRKMLDIMQKVIGNRDHKIMRLDGTISSVQEREQRIQKFQTDPSYSVFLLTTQVGGVGLTLTAADRVVIYDPSWNPATDAQAVDRVFRIGQDKNVVIYRLITCGTVEEKIYRRQIFKDSITRQTTGNAKNPYRYFSKYELRELFTLDDPHSSTTQQQLESMHSGQRLTDPSLDEHIAYLYSLDMFGLSDHDLMFSQGSEAGDHQDQEDHHGDSLPENDYILHRVQKAREIIEMESTQSNTLEERLGKGPQQGSVAGQFGRNQFQNWDFPKREENDIKEEEEVEEKFAHIDLTQSSPQPVVKTEPTDTIDLVSPQPSPKLKREPDHDLLETPHIKQEGRYGDRSVTHEPDNSMEIGTPVGTPRKKQEADTSRNMDSVHRKSVSKGASVIGSPLRHRGTPDSGSSDIPVVSEEILISPVSGPLIQTRPSSVSDMSVRSVRDFRPALHSTMFGTVDSPDVESGDSHGNTSRITNNSRGSSSASEDSIIVQDSPDLKRGRQPFKLIRPIVEESPANVGARTGSGEGDTGSSFHSARGIDEEQMDDGEADNVGSVIIDDSVIVSDNEEKENMEPGNISVHDVMTILEKSLRHTGDEMTTDTPVNQEQNMEEDFSSSTSEDIADDGDQNDDGDVDLEYSNNRSAGQELDSVDENNLSRMRNTSGNRVPNENGAEADGDFVEEADDVEGEEESVEEEEAESEEDEDEFAALPEEQQLLYNELIERGRTFCQNKEYESGLVCVLQALEIYADEELQLTAINIRKKIARRQLKAQMETGPV